MVRTEKGERGGERRGKGKGGGKSSNPKVEGTVIEETALLAAPDHTDIDICLFFFLLLAKKKMCRGMEETRRRNSKHGEKVSSGGRIETKSL